MENLKFFNFRFIKESSLEEYFSSDIFLSIIFFLLCVFIRKKLAQLSYNKIFYLINKFSSHIKDEDLNSFKKPLELIPFILYFSFLSVNLENSIFVEYINNLNKSLFSILLFTFFYYLISSHKNFSILVEKYSSKEFYIWFRKSFAFIIVFLIIVSVLEIWGIEIGPIIAGLGLIGVAVALGAQDLFKNLISGFIILIEKKFQIGDIICLDGELEGTVEDIGFRSTLIRKFNTELVSTPNFLFSEKKITNYSRRINRRVNWTLGFEYSSSVDQLKSFTNSLLAYLKENDSFLVNADYKSVVRLEKFNDSSIDLLIICHTNTGDWNEYLLIKERLAYQVKLLAKDLGLSFAFPTRKIYYENS